MYNLTIYTSKDVHLVLGLSMNVLPTNLAFDVWTHGCQLNDVSKPMTNAKMEVGRTPIGVPIRKVI